MTDDTDNCTVALPEFTLDDRICGFSIIPVDGWGIEGSIDHGRIIPIFDDCEPDGLYAIGYPDGSYRFPDGERCSLDELFEAFRRRLT